MRTWRRGMLALAWAALMFAAARTGADGGNGWQTQQPNPERSIHDPSLTQPPDANQQMEMRENQKQKQNFDAANEARRKQIAEDSAKLLQLANELKNEVDKSTKDTLSLSVIRKADEIERLARGVKEKMKLTVGRG